MSTLPFVLLGGDWRCDYMELEPSVSEWAESEVIPSLFDWSFDQRRREGWIAWLSRTFDLPPIEDECLNYWLIIKSAPTPLELHLNGRDLGTIQTPFELDISDMVALDDNRIAFRIPAWAVGSFGDVRIKGVPCE